MAEQKLNSPKIEEGDASQLPLVRRSVSFPKPVRPKPSRQALRNAVAAKRPSQIAMTEYIVALEAALSRQQRLS